MNQAHLFPDTPILSEENKEIEYSIRKNWIDCFIIDPTDLMHFRHKGLSHKRTKGKERSK